MKYKTISLLQPWATLFVMGLKRIETRSWSTAYTGPLLVHASGTAKKKNDAGKALWDNALCNNIDIAYECLPFGSIIGMVNITEMMKFGSQRSMDYLTSLSPDERLTELAFGNWEAGRHGWVTDKAYQFAKPYPAKGKLSVWDWQGELDSEDRSVYDHWDTERMITDVFGKPLSLFDK